MLTGILNRKRHVYIKMRSLSFIFGKKRPLLGEHMIIISRHFKKQCVHSKSESSRYFVNSPTNYNSFTLPSKLDQILPLLSQASRNEN